MGLIDDIRAEQIGILQRLDASKVGLEFNQIITAEAKHLVYWYDTTLGKTCYMLYDDFVNQFKSENSVVSSVANADGTTSLFQNGNLLVTINPASSDNWEAATTTLSSGLYYFSETQETADFSLNLEVGQGLTLSDPFKRADSAALMIGLDTEKFTDEDGNLTTGKLHFNVGRAMIKISKIAEGEYLVHKDVPVVDVEDTNTAVLKHEIAKISGESINETITQLQSIELTGGNCIVRYLGENGIIQNVSSPFEMSNLLNDLGGDTLFNGQHNFDLVLTDGSGHQANLSIGGINGFSNLIDSLALYVGTNTSSISFQNAVASIAGLINYNTNIHDQYTDRSLIDKEWNDLSNAHNTFNQITYYDNSGDLETNLNALTGDYFLVKNGANYYFSSKITSLLEASNCDFAIKGNPIINRAVKRISSTDLDTNNLASSYNFYDVGAVDTSGLTSGELYSFTFWRKKFTPELKTNLTAFNATLRFANTDASYFNDFANNTHPDNTAHRGFGSITRIGDQVSCYMSFTGITTNSAPNSDAQLVITDLPLAPVPASGLPGAIILSICVDDVGGNAPSWNARAWVGRHVGSANFVSFYDNDTRDSVKGISMNNATIRLHFIYQTGTL